LGAFANPYVLVAFLAVAGGYAVTEKVKTPVKAAYHQVERGVKKVVHVVHLRKGKQG
jgi:hypothetical protein